MAQAQELSLRHPLQQQGSEMFSPLDATVNSNPMHLQGFPLSAHNPLRCGYGMLLGDYDIQRTNNGLEVCYV